MVALYTKELKVKKQNKTLQTKKTTGILLICMFRCFTADRFQKPKRSLLKNRTGQL